MKIFLNINLLNICFLILLIFNKFHLCFNISTILKVTILEAVNLHCRENNELLCNPYAVISFKLNKQIEKSTYINYCTKSPYINSSFTFDLSICAEEEISIEMYQYYSSREINYFDSIINNNSLKFSDVNPFINNNIIKTTNNSYFKGQYKPGFLGKIRLKLKYLPFGTVEDWFMLDTDVSDKIAFPSCIKLRLSYSSNSCNESIETNTYLINKINSDKLINADNFILKRRNNLIIPMCKVDFVNIYRNKYSDLKTEGQYKEQRIIEPNTYINNDMLILNSNNNNNIYKTNNINSQFTTCIENPERDYAFKHKFSKLYYIEENLLYKIILRKTGKIIDYKNLKNNEFDLEFKITTNANNKLTNINNFEQFYNSVCISNDLSISRINNILKNEIIVNNDSYRKFFNDVININLDKRNNNNNNNIELDKQLSPYQIKLKKSRLNNEFTNSMNNFLTIEDTRNIDYYDDNSYALATNKISRTIKTLTDEKLDDDFMFDISNRVILDNDGLFGNNFNEKTIFNIFALYKWNGGHLNYDIIKKEYYLRPRYFSCYEELAKIIIPTNVKMNFYEDTCPDNFVCVNSNGIISDSNSNDPRIVFKTLLENNGINFLDIDKIISNNMNKIKDNINNKISFIEENENIEFDNDSASMFAKLANDNSENIINNNFNYSNLLSKFNNNNNIILDSNNINLIQNKEIRLNIVNKNSNYLKTPNYLNKDNITKILTNEGGEAVPENSELLYPYILKKVVYLNRFDILFINRIKRLNNKKQIIINKVFECSPLIGEMLQLSNNQAMEHIAFQVSFNKYYKKKEMNEIIEQKLINNKLNKNNLNDEKLIKSTNEKLDYIKHLINNDCINKLDNKFIESEINFFTKYFLLEDADSNLYIENAAVILFNLTICDSHLNKRHYIKLLFNDLMEGLCFGDDKSLSIFREILMNILINSILNINYLDYKDLQAKINIVNTFNKKMFKYSLSEKTKFLEDMLLLIEIKQKVIYILINTSNKEKVNERLENTLKAINMPINNSKRIFNYNSETNSKYDNADKFEYNPINYDVLIEDAKNTDNLNYNFKQKDVNNTINKKGTNITDINNNESSYIKNSNNNFNTTVNSTNITDTLTTESINLKNKVNKFNNISYNSNSNRTFYNSKINKKKELASLLNNTTNLSSLDINKLIYNNFTSNLNITKPLVNKVNNTIFKGSNKLYNNKQPKDYFIEELKRLENNSKCNNNKLCINIGNILGKFDDLDNIEISSNDNFNNSNKTDIITNNIIMSSNTFNNHTKNFKLNSNIKYYRYIKDIYNNNLSSYKFNNGMNLIVLDRINNYSKIYEHNYNTHSSIKDSDYLANYLKQVSYDKIIIITGIGSWFNYISQNLVKEIKQIGGPDINKSILNIKSRININNKLNDNYPFVLIGRKGLCRYNGLYIVSNASNELEADNYSKEFYELYKVIKFKTNNIIELNNEENNHLNSINNFKYSTILDFKYDIDSDNRFSNKYPVVYSVYPNESSFEGDVELTINGLGFNNIIEKVLINNIKCNNIVKLSEKQIRCINNKVPKILSYNKNYINSNIIVFIKNSNNNESYVLSSAIKTCNHFRYVKNLNSKTTMNLNTDNIELKENSKINPISENSNVLNLSLSNNNILVNKNRLEDEISKLLSNKKNLIANLQKNNKEYNNNKLNNFRFSSISKKNNRIIKNNSLDVNDSLNIISKRKNRFSRLVESLNKLQ